MTHTDEREIDPAHWAEVATDAGTRTLETRDPDDYSDAEFAAYRWQLDRERPKFCRDCEHFERSRCWHERNTAISYVTGEPATVLLPSLLRNESDLCGPQGAWWHGRYPK